MSIWRLFRPVPTAGSPQWLVAGLGNPGREYANNRHNVGFQVVDKMAAENHLDFDEQRNRARLGRGEIEGVKLTLVKPQTFMNLSGEAVGSVARFYKIPAARVLVIYDDLDLPVGNLRLRAKGGAGGHGGMKSIIQHLGTQEFPRMRIGIGRPPGRMPAEAYVLQDFKDDELEIMAAAYDQAIQAVRLSLREGFPVAMNGFN